MLGYYVWGIEDTLPGFGAFMFGGNKTISYSQIIFLSTVNVINSASSRLFGHLAQWLMRLSLLGLGWWFNSIQKSPSCTNRSDKMWTLAPYYEVHLWRDRDIFHSLLLSVNIKQLDIIWLFDIDYRPINTVISNTTVIRFSSFCHSGQLCDGNIDECTILKPCMNNATCLDAINGYNCHCQPGWTGLRCEQDIDDCISGACQNGGNCTDLINGFSCECAFGYAGMSLLCIFPGHLVSFSLLFSTKPVQYFSFV